MREVGGGVLSREKGGGEIETAGKRKRENTLRAMRREWWKGRWELGIVTVK
jgi:hypothetical protein